MQTILLTKPRHCSTQMYHHTPKAPLTETTSLVYHDPVHRFAAERHHPDGWPSSKVQGVCVCVCVCVICFVDMKKGYDSVNREALWVALGRRYGLPMKILNILKALQKDTSGAVRAYGKVSKEFAIGNGVRQGDVLAPTLFNLSLMLLSAWLWKDTRGMDLLSCSTRILR